MSTFEFLSDPWLDAVFALQAEYRDRVPAPMAKMKLNQEITAVPFGDGTVKLNIDTTSGKTILNRGHVEGADATISLEYATAKALMVNQDQQAAMQAFMQGKIKVVGDMSKVMVPPPPKNDAQKELDQKIKEITAA